MEEIESNESNANKGDIASSSSSSHVAGASAIEIGYKPTVYTNNKRKLTQREENMRSRVKEAAPEYLIDAKTGVRSVVPYVHDFRTFVKGRWIGRELLEVLCREFGSHGKDYWEEAISVGNVRIDKKIVSCSHKLKNGEALLHRTHRHEPPVVGQITFVGEEGDLVAVCKPSSLPMHPCGAYRQNSLTSILQHEPLIPNQQTLRMVHRLDRVTSGLVVLAKSQEAANRVSEEIRTKTTRKTYLARVKGNFPLQLSHIKTSKNADDILNDILCSLDDVDDEQEESAFASTEGSSEVAAKRQKIDGEKGGDIKVSHGGTVVHAAVDMIELGMNDAVCYGSFCPNDTAIDSFRGLRGQEYILLSCPVGVANHREGIHTCCPTGKKAISMFRKLGYDTTTDTSLVECIPITGRTHQLRLHLQFLGSPIANDPCYGGELFYNQPTKRADAVRLLTKMRLLNQMPMSKVPHLLSEEVDEILLAMPDTEKEQIRSQSLSEISRDSATVTLQTPQLGEDILEVVRHCRYCKDENSPELERILHCDGIWLHALRYEGKSWSFQAPLPEWSLLFGCSEISKAAAEHS